MKNICKQNKAITLVSIVITIIALLILSGVAIQTVIGDSGLINKAGTAKAETEKAQIMKIIQVELLKSYDHYGNLDIIDLKNNLKNIKKLDIKFPEDVNTFPLKVEIGKYNIKISSDGKLKYILPEAVEYTELKIGDYISNYPVYYNNVKSDGETEGSIPQDKYNGWRIVDIDLENETVKLVSAGIPLSFYHDWKTAVSVENLTTKFFSTSIANKKEANHFNESGFKISETSEETISDINAIKELFNNDYTDTYKEGESAEYTDAVLKETFTNSDVIGQPKVQALTIEVIHYVDSESVKKNDLVGIPNKSSGYSRTILGSAVRNKSHKINRSRFWTIS